MNLEIANRLVEYRKKAGLSQEELADKLGISRQAVSKWERVEASPDTDNLIALANLYGISLDELIYGGGNPNVNKEETKAEETGSEEVESETVEAEVIDDRDTAHIKINSDGIYIHGKDENDEADVIIDKSGVHVTRDGETKTYNKHSRPSKLAAFLGILHGVITLGVVAAYLFLGFVTKNGFALFWPMFIAIPVIPSFIEAIAKRRFCKLNVPCIVTSTYCFLGMMLPNGSGWHPWWLLFFIIPIYYTIFGPVDKLIHHNAIEED